MTGKTKICPFCQTEFFTDQNAQVYCSERCRRGMFAKKKREKNKSREFTCAYCGDAFVSDRKQKYCCKDCKLKANGRLVAKPKPRKKSNLSLAQINELARAAGMNYGQYVAKMGL